MHRFNLSAWAVKHPALMLFLIVMFGLAGLVSYRSLGSAEDPSFTIKVVVVTAMWSRGQLPPTAAQVADPIRKKLQELPYRQGDDLRKPAFTAMQVAFKDNTPARDVPVVLPVAQEDRRHKDDLPRAHRSFCQ
jgi:multidrug efflux pump subunit AcrB